MSDDHKHDELKVCKTCLYAGMDSGRQTTLDEVKKAIEVWKSQGRDEHDLWAMNNFLTGQGAFILDTLSTKGE